MLVLIPFFLSIRPALSLWPNSLLQSDPGVVFGLSGVLFSNRGYSVVLCFVLKRSFGVTEQRLWYHLCRVMLTH